MRENEDVVLSSSCGRIVLVPYTEHHVPTYHKWMSSPELLRLTGSDPLGLEAEFESCAAWREDASKLTFIVLNAADGSMVGDVNVVFDVDAEDRGVAEVDIMIAVSRFRRKGYAHLALEMATAYAAGLPGRRITSFVAKIVDDNVASIRLFEKMGFNETKRIPAFNEVHLILPVEDSVQKSMEEMRLSWKQDSYSVFLAGRGTRPWS